MFELIFVGVLVGIGLAVAPFVIYTVLALVGGIGWIIVKTVQTLWEVVCGLFKRKEDK